MPRILWKWFIKGQGFLVVLSSFQGSLTVGHLISIAKWPISLRHHHCSLFQEPSAAFWRACHGAISCSYFQHQCLQMENVCCFGREMSTILDCRCKQKITLEPNRNESGIDWWPPRLIKKECVCVFNWCSNFQQLRKWPLGGSSKWHTNIYYRHKHFYKHIHASLGV